MPAVDVLRKKREMGYDDARDQAMPPARSIPIAPEEMQSFIAMGYAPGQPVNLAVQGIWDGESVSVDTVECMPPQSPPGPPPQAAPAGPMGPQAGMAPGPLPG